MKNHKANSFQGLEIILESDSMEELQSKLAELISLRESYMINARNDESLNDEIRELQSQISQLKS